MDDYDDLKGATPEELLESVKYAWRNSKLPQEFFDGMDMGFKLGKGDWRQVAPAWLREWRKVRDRDTT
jgi:hypothetical protein